MNILFLDDNNQRIKRFREQSPYCTVVMTAEQCIKKLEQEEQWDEVHLDHDLGGEIHVDSDRKDCGMEVVRWIVENRPNIGTVIVHSRNTLAAKEMWRKLLDANYHARLIPFRYYDSNIW